MVPVNALYTLPLSKRNVQRHRLNCILISLHEATCLLRRASRDKCAIVTDRPNPSSGSRSNTKPVSSKRKAQNLNQSTSRSVGTIHQSNLVRLLFPNTNPRVHDGSIPSRACSKSFKSGSPKTFKKWLQTFKSGYVTSQSMRNPNQTQTIWTHRKRCLQKEVYNIPFPIDGKRFAKEKKAIE